MLVCARPSIGAEPSDIGGEAVMSGSLDPQQTDAFTWLEDATSTRTIAWVREQNQRVSRTLKANSRFEQYYDTALSVLRRKNVATGDASSSILHGGWVYNILRDEVHPRGVWRRAPINSYTRGSPSWEPLLDVDALARQEGKALVLSSKAQCLGERCLLTFLLDGGFAAAHREFDLKSGTFPGQAFSLPVPSKQFVSWKDNDTLLVSKDFGANTTGLLGNPIVVKEWSRGKSLSDAKEVFRGASGDVAVLPQTFVDEEGRLSAIIVRGVGGHLKTYWKITASGEARRMTLPSEVRLFGVHKGEWIFEVQEDWTLGAKSWKSGTLLSIPDTEILNPSPSVRIMLEPPPRSVVIHAAVTRDGVLVSTTENVRARLWRLTIEKEAGRWNQVRVPLPGDGTIEMPMTSPTEGIAFVTYQDFVTPPSVYAVEVRTNRVVPVSHEPGHFDGSKYVIQQFEAVSKDGTRVPYFIVLPKGFRATGDSPTLVWGYGSVGSLQQPRYDPTLGTLWLERGGVYVLANIRGGSEFGRDWVLRGAERQRTYDDFIAVAEDLVRRKITNPRRLGIRGHSNGGLLVAVTLNSRPELFNAAIIENPALDQLDQRRRMGRAYVIDLGAWDDAEDLAFLRRTSPYQNLTRRESFPVPLVITNSNDSMQPYYARKYVAKALSLGMDALFCENPQGGHGMGITIEDRASHDALIYTYLAQRLMSHQSD